MNKRLVTVMQTLAVLDLIPLEVDSRKRKVIYTDDHVIFLTNMPVSERY